MTERAVVTDAKTHITPRGSEVISLTFLLQNGRRVFHYVKIPMFEKLVGWKFRPELFLGVEYFLVLSERSYNGVTHPVVVDLRRVNE